MKKQKIIILGGNPETGAIVDVANKMGLHTIVIDPYPNAPAKKNAHSTYNIDVRETDKINKIIKNEQVGGVLVGVADPLVPYYEKICRENNFPCYATKEIINYFSSKSNFAGICSKNNINVIPSYSTDSDLNKLAYPVVIKPVDSGAGVGISICNTPIEAEIGIKKALEVSIKKEYLIEKYMECDDMFAYYTFINGEVYLSALADRYKTKKQGTSSSVCIAAEYPSKYKEIFIEKIHPKLVLMFKKLGVHNGVLLIQFFVDQENFYAYDPGFRIQGEAPHIYLKHFNNFDHREMLINFAMTGSMYSGNFSEKNNCLFSGEHAATLWVLLKAGTIGKISGIAEIKSHPNVINFIQRFNSNDIIENNMLRTERQVFCRIYTTAKEKSEVQKTINFIKDNLIIEDNKKQDMILDFWNGHEK